MNLEKEWKAIKDDVDSAISFSDSIYEETFSHYFSKVHELYSKMKSKEDIIPDNDLEWILTSLPLELFSVSADLTRLKTTSEVLKAEAKKREYYLVGEYKARGMSATEAKEIASIETEDVKLLISSYNSLFERVEKEVSFARELIMSAKKVWDSRRAFDAPMPVIKQQEEPDLPYYDTKKYIK